MTPLSEVPNKSDRELIVEIHGAVTTLVEQGKDHEKRIRSLESWRWGITGAGVLFGIVVGYIGSWVPLMQKFFIGK